MLAFPVALGAAFVVSAIVLWGLGRWFPRSKLSLALAGGTAAGHVGMAAGNEFSAAEPGSGIGEILRATVTTFTSPSEAGNWVVLVLLVASVVAWLAGVWQRPAVDDTTGAASLRHTPQGGWKGVILWGVIYTATLLRLLWGSVYLTRRWSVGEAVVTIAAQVIAVLVIVLLSRPPVNNRVRSLRFVLVTLTAIAACAVIGMSGSAVYAQLLATGVVGLVLCSWVAWRQRAGGEVGEWPIGMIVLVVGTHLWLGHYFAELSLLDGGLLLGSLAAGAAYGWGGEARPVWLNRVIPAVVSVSLLIAAVAHASITLSRALANPGW